MSLSSCARIVVGSSPPPTAAGRGGGDAVLDALSDVARELSGALEIERSFARALDLLAPALGARRASIALLDDEAGEISVETAVGFEPDPRTVRWRPGQGVTGRVVESGQPIVVPRASSEPMFLARGGRPGTPDDDASFLCVPIQLGERAVGALGVLLPFDPRRDLLETVKALKIVAVVLAQRLRVHRLVQAEHQRLRDENAHLRLELRERYDYASIVGKSGPMRLVYEQISQVSGTTTTVLVRGESGTGKELIAQAIHYNSSRAKEPFVRVNCAALPESLIESELFGHEKGAFTGAQARRKGRFELAEGGTIFLDEIGDLSPSTQVKLLRVLQERELERVGGTETVSVNVRVIAATNADLEKAIAAGTFREDLYYRLHGFIVFVPPLRERRSDIMLLCDHFIAKYAAEHGKNIKRLSTPAIDMLMGYHWPGNVRELENTIERAIVVCDGSVIHAHHMPPALQTAEASGTAVQVSLADAVGKFERGLIEDALKSARGNRAQAARLLQTTERILSYKVKKFRIDVDRCRA